MKLFKTLFILLFCSTLSATPIAVFEKYPYNPYVEIDVWDRVEPYFLPENHPIKPILDQMFSKERISKNEKSLKKAGFQIVGAGVSKASVVAHPLLPNHILKIYTDDKTGKCDWQKWLNRIIGARLTESIITRYGFQNLMTVPQKWMYPLPEDPAPSRKSNRKNFILVVDKKATLNNQENRSMWKSSSIPTSFLDAFYLVITEAGLSDSMFPPNVPFTTEGKAAFVDTEFHSRENLRLSRLGKHLSKENKNYWKALISQAVKFQNDFANRQ